MATKSDERDKFYQKTTLTVFKEVANEYLREFNSYSGDQRRNPDNQIRNFMQNDFAQPNVIENSITVMGVPYLKGRGVDFSKPVLSIHPDVQVAYQDLKELLRHLAPITINLPKIEIDGVLPEPLMRALYNADKEAREKTPAPRLLGRLQAEERVKVEIRPKMVKPIPILTNLPHWNVIPSPRPAVQLSESHHNY